jgi:carbon monoxide dehydrogenase subunit G
VTILPEVSVQLENRFTVPVPVDQAWQVLTDIEQVAPCMPGAALDSVNGDEFTGRVKVKLGPINLTYQGHASFVEKDPQAYRAIIDARGKDQRGNGTAAAVITASLTAQGDTTVVNVLTDLNITGRPAQFGRGVMTDVGNKLLGQFADKLAAQLGAGGPVGAGTEAAPEKAAPEKAAPEKAAPEKAAAKKAAPEKAAAKKAAPEKTAPAKMAAAAAGAAEEVAASAEQLEGAGSAAQAVKKTAAAAKKTAASAADKVEQPAKAEPAKDLPAKKAPSGPPAGTTAPPPRPATGAPGKAAPGPAGPTRLQAAADPEPIDLLEVAGGAAMARLAVPALGATLGLLLIIWLLRRRARH